MTCSELFVCARCGAEISEPGTGVRRGRQVFCSPRCVALDRLDRRAETGTKRRRVCAECGAEFTPNRSTIPRKYCGPNCFYAAQRRARTEPVVLECAWCGRCFTRLRAYVSSNTKPVFCSRECQARGRSRAGSSRGRGRGWRAIAESVRARDGWRCVRCGRSEAEEGARLAVDHVVPWVIASVREQDANHPDNLASLCRRCHGVKTSVVEPRLLRGDFVALRGFYGAERADRAVERAWP